MLYDYDSVESNTGSACVTSFPLGNKFIFKLKLNWPKTKSQQQPWCCALFMCVMQMQMWRASDSIFRSISFLTGRSMITLNLHDGRNVAMHKCGHTQGLDAVQHFNVHYSGWELTQPCRTSGEIRDIWPRLLYGRVTRFSTKRRQLGWCACIPRCSRHRRRSPDFSLHMLQQKRQTWPCF